MISFTELAIGTGGVVSCARCGPATAAEPFAADELIAHIAALAASAEGDFNVVLGGFEPFRHPGLPALISACAESGARRIMLRTDAGALANPGNAEGCLAAGVRALEIELLAEGALHDALAARVGLGAAASAGTAAFRVAAASAGVDVAVFGVLQACRHNAGELASTIAAFAQLGAAAVRIECGRLPNTPANAAALAAAVHTGAVNRVAVSVAGYAGNLPALADLAAYQLVGGA
ncbi:MAG TPA: hypothetical protein VFG89_01285 [Coriobacteriia bacterium]|nr:hypothetical protein [Coriobacteriia bacterium]